VRSSTFFIVAAATGAVLFGLSLYAESDYFFFAGYVVLQFVVLATAWNILGGYCGYVNFGSAAFFALGAYSSVALHKFDASIDRWFPDPVAAVLHVVFPLPIPILVLFGGFVSAVVGLGTGYLTLRLRGAFFAIATLALAVVLQTLIINWDYVGGSRGAYIIRPSEFVLGGLRLSYIQYLFLIMLALSVIAISMARTIERSKLGYGFATIRDDELAAEASGVPTLRLKLTATTLSGMLMGMAGAPFPYYIGYLEPSSAFGLAYAVNSIAMPMIGGTTTWLGPLIGALLLGTLQQVATVTISSAVNLLLVGVLLVSFVIIAPNGIVGEREPHKRLGIAALIVAIFAAFVPDYGVYAGWFSLALVAMAVLYGDRAFVILVLGISVLHYLYFQPVLLIVDGGIPALVVFTVVMLLVPLAAVVLHSAGKLTLGQKSVGRPQEERR
jgi:branched-chain amino acid transport system permease protein